jgi:hypothetical protein
LKPAVKEMDHSTDTLSIRSESEVDERPFKYAHSSSSEVEPAMQKGVGGGSKRNTL